ncbi:helicase sen1 [Trichoderma arundinaceum]|uniref:Helicase sen1 n=1 Tax=Trichoderma arundinaceum TaxID=490622 RepID=A0A395NYI4_TRIAR|nr:helicase sen1 [Trichoderma arundinaceum]
MLAIDDTLLTVKNCLKYILAGREWVPDSKSTADKKKSRMQESKDRIEVTYWNSLIFGFDKQEAGKWLEDFTGRLENCLKYCPECVFPTGT